MSARPRPLARWSGPLRLALGVVALPSAPLFGACRTTENAPPAPVVREEWPLPPDDRVGECADVGELRVCWSGRGAGDVRLAPRRTPRVRPSPLGLRCYGSANAVRCVDRSRDAAPFRCDGAECRQRAPRMPDSGEWECADFAGIVVCRGGVGAAVVPPGASEPGFMCGPRRGAQAAPGERVCVDLSPDFPDGRAEEQRCRFETDGALFRVCAADASARAAGDRCGPSRGCDTGLSCIEGRCLPRRPEPACWLDRDCDKGACRFGSCVEDGA